MRAFRIPHGGLSLRHDPFQRVAEFHSGAANFGFFSRSDNHPEGSAPLGRVVVDGQELVGPSGNGWGVLGVDPSGNPQMVRESDNYITGYPWAIAGGPRIVHGGEKQPYEDLQGYSGLIPRRRHRQSGEPVRRIAVGFDPLNFYLVYAEGANFADLADAMIYLGADYAMTGDGGSSASVALDGEHLGGQQLVPNALVFDDYEEAGILPNGPKVYLSPAEHFGQNVGVGEYGTETKRTEIFAEETAKRLRHAGVVVKIGDSDYETHTRESNAWSADIHVVIHTNALAGDEYGDGTLVMHYPGSRPGEELARSIYDVLAPATPGNDDGVRPRGDLHELSATYAPAAYVEVSFHDNPADARWMVENPDVVGETIAAGILDYFGIEQGDIDWQARAKRAEEKLARVREIVG